MKDERARRGLSQGALAAAIQHATGTKLDPTAVTRIERGTRTLRLDEAVAISTTFGLRLTDMLAQSPTLKERVQEAERREERAKRASIEARAELERAQGWAARLKMCYRLSDD